MSHSFALEAPSRPRFSAVLARLGLADLGFRQEQPADDVWPDGVFHFHRQHLSTRSTEITYDEGRIQVRALSFAAEHDSELALAFVEALAAELGSSSVDGENTGPIALKALRSVYDHAWIESQWRSGAGAIRALIGQGRGPLRRAATMGSRYRVQ
jgi:hypothetical protein